MRAYPYLMKVVFPSSSVLLLLALACLPAHADTDTIERFELFGQLPLAQTTQVGFTGMPVKGSHVGSSATLSLTLSPGTVIYNINGTTVGALLPCSASVGVATINIPDSANSQLFLELTGTGCQVSSATADTLAWFVTGGTGRYSGAIGSGTMTYHFGMANSYTAPGLSLPAPTGVGLVNMLGQIQRP